MRMADAALGVSLLGTGAIAVEKEAIADVIGVWLTNASLLVTIVAGLFAIAAYWFRIKSDRANIKNSEDDER